MTEYIDHKDVEVIRVFFEGDHWAVDGANAKGEYTKEVWNLYDDKEMDRETAIKAAPEFAAHIGRPDLADTLDVEKESEND